MEWSLKITMHGDGACTLILDCHLDNFHKARSVPVHCTPDQMHKAIDAYRAGALNILPKRRPGQVADEALSRALRAAAGK